MPECDDPSTLAMIVRALLIPLFLVLVALPSMALADTIGQFDPVIPEACKCEGLAPDYGCVLQVLQGVIRLAINIGFIFVVFALMYAGFLWMTSSTNPGNHAKAKQLLLNVFVGIGIMLSSWLLVDFVMKTLYKENDAAFGPWNSILADTTGQYCLVPTESLAITTGSLEIEQSVPRDQAYANNGSGGSVANIQGKSGLDVQAAVAHAQQNSVPKPTNRCAEYVRKALAAGGLSEFASGQGNASGYGPSLTGAGFVPIYSGTYSSASENLAGLRAGDVVVFQSVPGHRYGHIAIYDGRQWVSDYRQRTMSSNQKNYQGGKFTIYRP